MKTLKKIQTLGQHSSAAYAVSTGMNGLVLSGGSDKILASWDLGGRKAHNFSIKTDHGIYSTAYSEKQSLLLIGASNGHIHWIDLKLKQEIKNYQVHQKGVFSMSICDDILYASGGEGSISLWDLNDQSFIRQVPLCGDKIRQVKTDKEHVIAACGNGRFHILDKNMNDLIAVDAHEQSCNAIGGIGNHVLSGGWDAHIKLWNSESGELLKSIPAHNYAIYDLALSDDGKYVASASRDKTIKLWDAESLELIQRLDIKDGGHTRSVNALVWQGEQLVSTGDDGKVILWELN